jgi:nucleoside-diphosphate-sugar epimerase
VRILVTGASGFVGSRLLPRLAAEGASVLATDTELDVRDAAALRAAVKEARPEALIHLAALSSVAGSFEVAEAVAQVNFLGTHAVLAALEAAAPRARLLLVSSGQVYGSAAPGAAPFDERAPLRPASPYAWSKAAADLLGRSFAEKGLDVVRVRPFNHTGPGQSEAFVAASLARQLAEIEAGRRPARIAVGNLDAVRDFLDVEDVVAAYLRLLDRAVPAGVYNVASGRGRRVREILERLLKLVRVRPEIEVDPLRFRPTDVSVGDASKLRQATGWEPALDLDDTLARLLEDWRARISAA